MIEKIFNGFYLYFLTPLIGFITPLATLFYLIIFLILVDLITALLRDWKIKKARTIRQKFRRVKSRKLRRTVVKMVLYILFITSVYSIPTICFSNSFMFAEIVTSILCIVELKSIAENMDIINENDIFTSIFSKIVKWLNEKINNGIEK